MPTVYLPKEEYDEIVRSGKDVNKFIAEAVREKLAKEGGRKK